MNLPESPENIGISGIPEISKIPSNPWNPTYPLQNVEIPPKTTRTVQNLLEYHQEFFRILLFLLVALGMKLF